MGTFFVIMIVALVFWGLGWRECEKFYKKKNPKNTLYADYLKELINELRAEIVVLKAQNKN